MKEYIILGNTQLTLHLEASEIWFISTVSYVSTHKKNTIGIEEQGAEVSSGKDKKNKCKNSSYIFLTNGKRIKVNDSLEEIKKTIDKYFAYSHDDFRRAGQSLIINTAHLYKIDSDRVYLLNRQSDGFMTGYSAGYSDCNEGTKPVCFNTQASEVDFMVSDNAIKDLKSFIEERYQGKNIMDYLKTLFEVK